MAISAKENTKQQNKQVKSLYDGDVKKIEKKKYIPKKDEKDL